MASTASTILRLELMANGENDGTWGTKVNTNLGILESALTGTTAISTTGGDTTLTNVDYTNDQAKKLSLDVTGALVSNATIIIPNAAKSYKVFNRTSGAYTLTIKTASGSGILITQSTGCEVYCDGANVMRYISPLTDFTTGAPVTASGAAANAVSVTPTGNLSSTNAQAALVELQTDINTINSTLTSSYQPLDSDLTTIGGLAKTDGNFIVGNGSAWVAESGATARTSLGVGTGDSPTFYGLTIAGASGAEGGEMTLAMPASGTSLAGNVIIDINSNSLRIFEGGGSYRGLRADLTAQGAQSRILTDATNGLTGATGLAIDAGTTGTLPVARGGTGVTGSTGSGSVVLSVSPTFTGTPLGPTAAASDTGTHLATCAFVWGTMGAPSGTFTTVHQTAAPLGWVKNTSYNDRALRLVNGTVTAGGTSAFTSVFANRTIAEANLPSHTHSFSATTSSDGAHQHNVTNSIVNTGSVSGGSYITTSGNDGAGDRHYSLESTNDVADRHLTSSNGAHTHTVSGTSGATGSGSAMDFAVAYIDLILIQKS